MQHITNLDKFIVYDVEVRQGPDEVENGWNNPEGMGFASAVAWSYETKRYHFYLHDCIGLLQQLQARTAVTFNGIRFDSRVILGNDRGILLEAKCVMGRGYAFRNYDILIEYLMRRENITFEEALEYVDKPEIHTGEFNLDGLSQGTLGIGKSGHGAHAPKLYQAAKYDELLEYNLQDVRLTRMLFEHIYSNSLNQEQSNKMTGFLYNRSGQSVNMLI